MNTLSYLRLSILFALCLWIGCGGTGRSVDPSDGGDGRIITATLIQLNDVYEITPVQGGARGGIARVATLRNRLRAEEPNTYTLLAGDFLSPSAIGTARVDGERLAGRQMVAALNALGLDYVTFGNHEFDIDRDQFLQRLRESRFTYVSANVTDEAGRPFPGVLPHAVLAVPGLPGDTLRLGLVGVTLPDYPADYVRFSDVLEGVRTQVDALEGRVDGFVALTHLTLEGDALLAESVPELNLILGGHEHENWYLKRGAGLTPIAKADANARTVYVHRLWYNPATGDLTIDSRLVEVTDALPDDPATARVVDAWVERAYDGFRQQGLEPAEAVTTLPEPFNGLESVVRNRSTRLTSLVADAMLHAVPGAEVSVYNSGSLRIDDILPPGVVTQYDVIRILPFGGDVVSVEMRGGLLDSVLTQGRANQGSGGFLHAANASFQDGRWVVGGAPLDAGRVYRVATNAFLVTGREAGLDYFTPDNPSLTEVGRHGDIRLAVIAELRRRFGER